MKLVIFFYNIYVVTFLLEVCTVLIYLKLENIQVKKNKRITFYKTNRFGSIAIRVHEVGDFF